MLVVVSGVSSLVKKTDYDAKILDIENKVSDHDHDFKARLAQANTLTKIQFDAKLKNLNQKINSNKTKHLLVENELKKLQKFDLSYFRGKTHFGDDVAQNYLIFQPMNKYFMKINNTVYILEWKSKVLSNEVIKPATTIPALSYFNIINGVKCDEAF